MSPWLGNKGDLSPCYRLKINDFFFHLRCCDSHTYATASDLDHLRVKMAAINFHAVAAVVDLLLRR